MSTCLCGKFTEKHETSSFRSRAPGEACAGQSRVNHVHTDLCPTGAESELSPAHEGNSAQPALLGTRPAGAERTDSHKGILGRFSCPPFTLSRRVRLHGGDWRLQRAQMCLAAPH